MHSLPNFSAMITNTQPISAEELSAAEKRKAYLKAYAEANKEKIKAYRKANNKQHREKQRSYYNANKEKCIAATKAYYEANKEYCRERYKAYHSKNRDRIVYKQREYHKEKMKEELYRLKHCLRTAVCDAFKRISAEKPAKTETLLGCTWQQAKEHFEKLFEPGMTWQNHGKWHIDHIKPVSSFTMENLHEMNCISNLQPLWAVDNLSKGTKQEAVELLNSTASPL